MGDTPSFSFSWHESGGPREAVPTRKGFGGTLLKSANVGIDASPNIEFAPKGVYYTPGSDAIQIGACDKNFPGPLVTLVNRHAKVSASH